MYQFIKKVRQTDYYYLVNFISHVSNASAIFLQPPIEDEYKTPDIIFRYQIEQGDVQEVLQKDRDALNALIQVNSL